MSASLLIWAFALLQSLLFLVFFFLFSFFRSFLFLFFLSFSFFCSFFFLLSLYHSSGYLSYAFFFLTYLSVPVSLFIPFSFSQCLFLYFVHSLFLNCLTFLYQNLFSVLSNISLIKSSLRYCVTFLPSNPSFSFSLKFERGLERKEK